MCLRLNSTNCRGKCTSGQAECPENNCSLEGKCLGRSNTLMEWRFFRFIEVLSLYQVLWRVSEVQRTLTSVPSSAGEMPTASGTHSTRTTTSATWRPTAPPWTRPAQTVSPPKRPVLMAKSQALEKRTKPSTNSSYIFFPFLSNKIRMICDQIRFNQN